jgi:hypothetical protein
VPSQWVARQELSWGAHQLGAHSLCDRTREPDRPIAETLFFRAVNNYIPSFTGLAPQMLEEQPWECVRGLLDSNRGLPRNRHAGSAGDK